MENKHLHIISFNIPWPADYGGVIDVFYKIKALHEAGVKIHLHCFQYGRKKSDELEKICEEVNYYQRDSFRKGFFSDKPFIVESRNSPALRKKLIEDNHPILFEGLHSCYYLPDRDLNNRLKVVRMHNDEAAYYLKLGQHEKRFFKKLYFFLEFRRLMKYENVLEDASDIFCISQAETEHYQKRFDHTSYLAPFHGNDSVTSKTGFGKYVLYHGNLGVNENEEVVLYLIDKIFPGLDCELVIAGSNPSLRIKNEVQKNTKIALIENPTHEKIESLLADAHIHILPTFTETGIKLKLINALFKGRFCLVNPLMVKNTNLEKYCIVESEPEAIRNKITELFKTEFTEQDIMFRKQIEGEYSDKKEVQKIISLL